MPTRRLSADISCDSGKLLLGYPKESLSGYLAIDATGASHTSNREQVHAARCGPVPEVRLDCDACGLREVIGRALRRGPPHRRCPKQPWPSQCAPHALGLVLVPLWSTGTRWYQRTAQPRCAVAPATFLCRFPGAEDRNGSPPTAPAPAGARGAGSRLSARSPSKPACPMCTKPPHPRCGGRDRAAIGKILDRRILVGRESAWHVVATTA